MRKLVLFILMGMLLTPTAVDAKLYKTKNVNQEENIPVRTPALNYVGVHLDESTGILALYCVGNVGTVQVTVTQNGAVIEDDYQSVSNGETVVYDLSDYAVGEYLLTIELGNGTTRQYIICVEDD